MQQKEGHGENGWKAPTNQNTLQWIMLGLEDDAPYITSKSHLFHKIGGCATLLFILRQLI